MKASKAGRFKRNSTGNHTVELLGPSFGFHDMTPARSTRIAKLAGAVCEQVFEYSESGPLALQSMHHHRKPLGQDANHFKPGRFRRGKLCS